MLPRPVPGRLADATVVWRCRQCSRVWNIRYSFPRCWRARNIPRTVRSSDAARIIYRSKLRCADVLVSTKQLNGSRPCSCYPVLWRGIHSIWGPLDWAHTLYGLYRAFLHLPNVHHVIIRSVYSKPMLSPPWLLPSSARDRYT